MQSASFSFRVIDLANDSVIAFYQPKKSLVPASTMKIVTTAAAFIKMGSYKKIETKLQYSGTITDSVLNGNIYIKGGGDPTLGSIYFTKKGTNQYEFFNTWALKIKALGIKKINGKIIGDAS